MVKKIKTIKIKYYLQITIFVCFCFVYAPVGAANTTIGVIMTGPSTYYKDMHKEFIKTLSAGNLGSQDIEIILQTPAPNVMSWINAARKLIAIDCDIIISYGASAAEAVLDQTSKIPVIYAGVYNPKLLGLIKNNSTGISATLPVKTVLSNLKSITNFKTLGVITNYEEIDTIIQFNEVKKLEGQLEFSSVRLDINNLRDQSTFNNIDALFFTTASVDPNLFTKIIYLVCQLKIPSVTIISGNAENCIVLTISANPQEQGHEAAILVKEVLKGAKPSILVRKQFTKVDIIINLKEARDLGLKIPFDLLSSATEIIK